VTKKWEDQEVTSYYGFDEKPVQFFISLRQFINQSSLWYRVSGKTKRLSTETGTNGATFGLIAYYISAPSGATQPQHTCELKTGRQFFGCEIMTLAKKLIRDMITGWFCFKDR
jgi:hypothetical protein